MCGVLQDFISDRSKQKGNVLVSTISSNRVKTYRNLESGSVPSFTEFLAESAFFWSFIQSVTVEKLTVEAHNGRKNSDNQHAKIWSASYFT